MSSNTKLGWAALSMMALVGTAHGAPSGVRVECDVEPAIRALASASIAAGKPEQAMTRAKLEADLGRPGAACALFSLVADATRAPAALRWEALARQGAVLRDAGDGKASTAAFQRITSEYGENPEAVKFLVTTVTGITPDPDYWEQAWKQVRLLVEGVDGELVTRVVWPSLSSTPELQPPWTGEPVSLNLKDANLTDVLRLFAEIASLELTVDAGVGKRSMTVVLEDVPWDEAFALVLKTQGLGARREGSGVRVFRPGHEGDVQVTPITQDFRARRSEEFATTVVIALQAYAQDHGTYPVFETQVDVAAIASLVEPAYVATVPRHDAFGKPLRYSSDGRTGEVRFTLPDGEKALSLPALRVSP